MSPKSLRCHYIRSKIFCLKCLDKNKVAELHLFHAVLALASGKNFDAAPSLAPAPIIPYCRPIFCIGRKFNIKVLTLLLLVFYDCNCSQCEKKKYKTNSILLNFFKI
jgi:hypothetical protein